MEIKMSLDSEIKKYKQMLSNAIAINDTRLTKYFRNRLESLEQAKRTRPKKD